MNKILFVIGALLILLPIGCKVFEQKEQENLISTYSTDLEQFDERELTYCLEQAGRYNQKLYETEMSEKEEYLAQLNLAGNGIMGYLQIDKICLKLPIYHETKEEVLANGIGHLEYTSLPVGGKNTHTVLTGHRGTPQAQLFTRLDELEIGDFFTISVCNQKLGYQVSDIRVVRPEEVEVLEIQENRDLVSLITCTPYGVNTHRLIVVGERIQETVEENLEEKGWWLSKRDIVLCMIPVVIFGIQVGKTMRKRKGADEKMDSLVNINRLPDSIECRGGEREH